MNDVNLEDTIVMVSVMMTVNRRLNKCEEYINSLEPKNSDEEMEFEMWDEDFTILRKNFESFENIWFSNDFKNIPAIQVTSFFLRKLIVS